MPPYGEDEFQKEVAEFRKLPIGERPEVPEAPREAQQPPPLPQTGTAEQAAAVGADATPSGGEPSGGGAAQMLEIVSILRELLAEVRALPQLIVNELESSP